MRADALALALGLAAAAGCFDGPTIDDEPCPTPGTALTYDGFGGPFFATWCQGCHGSQILDRHGAPHDVVFDTVEQIRDYRERVFERAASSNTSMPPGLDDPPEAERQRLAEWLACGAP